MHMDKLEYGWWEAKRGIVKLPTTLGDKRNIVLNLEEIKKYEEIMGKFEALAVRERSNARKLRVCLERRHLPTWEDPPHILTLAACLETQVSEAKLKLELLQFMVEISKRAVDVFKAANQSGDDSEQGNAKAAGDAGRTR